jgi:hypothetical protein
LPDPNQKYFCFGFGSSLSDLFFEAKLLVLFIQNMIKCEGGRCSSTGTFVMFQVPRNLKWAGKQTFTVVNHTSTLSPPLQLTFKISKWFF